MEVQVTRTKLPLPSIEDPSREVYHIVYQAGALPPHSIFIPVKDWSKAEEAKRIKEDVDKRVKEKPEIITI